MEGNHERNDKRGKQPRTGKQLESHRIDGGNRNENHNSDRTGKIRTHQRIKHNTLAKFLGALVLGAAMVAVTAPGFTPGQVQASENQLSVQTELGEEWFNPVTGESTGLLPKQIIPRSMGILARPLSIERLASWGPGEENFHSVTGENISEAVGSIKVSSFDLAKNISTRSPAKRPPRFRESWISAPRVWVRSTTTRFPVN